MKQLVIIVRPDRKSVTRTETREYTVQTRKDGSSFIKLGNNRVTVTRANDHVPFRVLVAA